MANPFGRVPMGMVATTSPLFGSTTVRLSAPVLET